MLACVRRPSDPDTLNRLIQAGLRWDRVVEIGESARVTSQVYYGLKMLPESSAIPAATIEELQQLTYGQIFHLMKLRRALDQVLAGFSRLSIPVVALKGAALTAGVYENSSLRVVGDLDLLIREADAGPAHELLVSLGFTPSSGENIGPDHHHLPGYSRDGGVRVELHRHIVPQSELGGIPIEEFWRRSRPIEGGGGMMIFAPEHLLLHACLHSAWSNSFLRTLYQLLDIPEIVRKYGSAVDWALLIAEAGDYGLRRPTYYALRAAVELAGADIPGEVLADLRPRGAATSPRHAALLGLMPVLALGFERRGPFPGWILGETCRQLMTDQSETAAWLAIGKNLLRRSWRALFRRMRPGTRTDKSLAKN